MIFLPTPGPLNTGGLDFVLSNKPSLPIFRPPPPPMSWVNYMIDMPEGYTRLTNRVSCLILPFQGGGEEEGCREMELIIRVDDGVAVLSGEGRAGFFNIIEAVEKEIGKPIYYYLGGTGFMAGMRNENTLSRLRALKKRHPPLKIYANHSTSVMGEEMIHSVFGTDFILAYPGERIKLTAPQREE